MAVDFDLPEEIRELEANLRRFAEAQLRPHARQAEERNGWDASVLRTLDDFGLPALDIPEALGGLGAGSLAKVVALEAIAWGDAGGLPDADLGPATAAILACPDTELMRELLQPCLAHEAAVHLTIRTGDEASGPVRIPWAAGSVPSRWVWLTRRKELVLFETDEAPVSHVDAGAFDAASGISIVQTSVLPAGSWVLSDEEAAALRGRARLWPAAVALGIATASYEYAADYAQERVVAGRPVAHHQANAFQIAEAAARIEGTRLAVRAAAARFDTGDPWAGAWATLAYLEAMDTAPWVCDLGVQLLGGHGYVEDHPAEKWFREARMLSLLWGGRTYAYADGEVLMNAPDSLMEG